MAEGLSLIVLQDTANGLQRLHGRVSALALEVAGHQERKSGSNAALISLSTVGMLMAVSQVPQTPRLSLPWSPHDGQLLLQMLDISI